MVHQRRSHFFFSASSAYFWRVDMRTHEGRAIVLHNSNVKSASAQCIHRNSFPFQTNSVVVCYYFWCVFQRFFFVVTGIDTGKHGPVRIIFFIDWLDHHRFHFCMVWSKRKYPNQRKKNPQLLQVAEKNAKISSIDRESRTMSHEPRTL